MLHDAAESAVAGMWKSASRVDKLELWLGLKGWLGFVK